MEYERAFSRLRIAFPEECDLRDGFHLPPAPAFLDAPGEFQHGLFPHAVAEVVRTAVHQYGRHQPVVPIVVVREAPQGRFHPAYDHRDLRPELLEDAGVDGHRAVRALACLALGGVGVVVAQALGGGVVVDHGIHRPGVHREIEPGSPQLAEIAQVVPPVRLRHDGHPVAPVLEPSGYAGGAETGVVHVCVTCEKDDVNIVPAELLDLLHGGGDHVIFHASVQKYETIWLFILFAL